ncbi:MAG: hypothetical protein J5944_07190 [Lentisphaeria bacterium]|nr:hypothetical protein [Lentisphaeria bacterium]
MKKQWMFLFFLPAFAGLRLLTVCRALPERNYLGMTRNEVASCRNLGLLLELLPELAEKMGHLPILFY